MPQQKQQLITPIHPPQIVALELGENHISTITIALVNQKWKEIQNKIFKNPKFSVLTIPQPT